MRILVIEDDEGTAESMKAMLESDGFDVHVTDLGQEGIDLATQGPYDIISLDLNLPDMSGYEVLKTLRLTGIHTPVIIVSGLNFVDNIRRGLAFGADDYMTKPFHKDEYVARIYAVVRRAKIGSPSEITTGEMVVDLDRKTIKIKGKRVHFTGKEYQMLELLSLRKGTTLTKEMFINHMYGGMDEPELKIVDIFICKIRKKIAAASDGANYIETVWGRGYVLRDPVTA